MTALAATGCSSGGASRPKEADLAFDASGRARVIVAQIGVDDGHLDLSHLVSGVLVDGIVNDSDGFEAWHVRGRNLNLAGPTTPRISEEETEAETVLRQLPQLQSDQDRKHHLATLTPDQAGHLLIARQLLDSGLLTVAGLPGVRDEQGHLVPTAAVDQWYTANADKPLVPGASVTLATEAARVVAEITKPQP
ncbi:MAG: hypothetical protein HOV97_29690 [Nonomuraea sp.]|nr:hypothetical protein [Nonomuraea sp.]